MKRIQALVPAIVGVLALSGALAPSAGAAEYEFKGLPEFGTCVRVAKHTGEYGDRACVRKRAGNTGKYNWIPATAGDKISYTFSQTRFQSYGASKALIKCGTGLGSGELLSSKTLELKTVLFTGCQNPEVAGEKTWCQKENGEIGIVEGTGFTGEVGYISRGRRPESIKVGLDLAGTLTFECEGANETLKKGTGSGTKREITGSVIGRITAIDMTTNKYSITHAVNSGKQVPEAFQFREKDTLTTFVTPFLSTSKTPEATTLESLDEMHFSTSLELKALCKIRGGTC